MTNSIIELHTQVPADLEGNVFGQFDEHLKLIERTLNVTLISRDGMLKILGTEQSATQAKKLIEELVTLAGRGNTITRQNVTYALSLAMEERNQVLTEIDKDFICNTIQGRPIKPKTLGQKEYVEQIRKKMIVFGIGPAGTGKTYLAMAMAVTAFRNEEVSRIILTRPAIEAGEKLGFLPGDLQSKVDPYLRPLYDALYQIMGADSFAKNMERGLIEVAPLAYMRGRTLDNAFIILDEAQNTTPAQMKMFLTRIGFGSKVVVTLPRRTFRETRYPDLMSLPKSLRRLMISDSASLPARMSCVIHWYSRSYRLTMTMRRNRSRQDAPHAAVRRRRNDHSDRV